jgi:hypothetical protein
MTEKITPMAVSVLKVGQSANGPIFAYTLPRESVKRFDPCGGDCPEKQSFAGANLDRNRSRHRADLDPAARA